MIPTHTPGGYLFRAGAFVSVYLVLIVREGIICFCVCCRLSPTSVGSPVVHVLHLVYALVKAQKKKVRWLLLLLLSCEEFLGSARPNLYHERMQY